MSKPGLEALIRETVRAAVADHAGTLGADPAKADTFAQLVGRRLRPLLAGAAGGGAPLSPDELGLQFTFHGTLSFGMPVIEVHCLACRDWTFTITVVLAAAMWEVLEEHHGRCVAAQKVVWL